VSSRGRLAGVSDHGLQGVQQRWCGSLQFGVMLDRQVAQHGLAGVGQRDEHAPSIVRILRTANEAAGGGPIDQFDRGVGLDLEPLGDGADGGWMIGVGQASQSEQELVLLGLEPGGVGGAFAEVEEAAELEAELSQGTQIGRSQGAHADKCIVTRYISGNQRRAECKLPLHAVVRRPAKLPGLTVWTCTRHQRPPACSA
jgi:hypothetical protein